MFRASCSTLAHCACYSSTRLVGLMQAWICKQAFHCGDSGGFLCGGEIKSPHEKPGHKAMYMYVPMPHAAGKTLYFVAILPMGVYCISGLHSIRH